MSQFAPEDKITDIVLPLMISSFSDPTRKIMNPPKELFGTGFLIGNRGFALTAAHVIDQLRDSIKSSSDFIITHIQNSTGLHPFSIVSFEKHPTEDVGIFRIEQEGLRSWLTVSKLKYFHSTPYTGWGYPKETAEELRYIHENPLLRPELIFTEGYIRRPISHELSYSMYIGNKFYEVSDLGGSGYSGAPILFKNTIRNPKWDVIGVYIGEKEGSGASVGYVVRSESFADWEPEILGCTIHEESLK